MFDFMLRRQIDRMLENAYRANLSKYKEGLRQLVAASATDIGAANNLRTQYLENVSRSIDSVIELAGPKVFARYRLGLLNLPSTGVYHPEAELCAGVIYCLMHYAFTGKPGKARDASKHNHLFATYVDKALHEIDAELQSSRSAVN